MAMNASEETFHGFTVKDAQGSSRALAEFKGQVVLVVNVASRCGFTPQYDGLEELYQKYKDQGLTIVGFPSNEFGQQEPGSNEEIQSFCRLDRGVTFPVMAKIEVNGPQAHPLFRWLKRSAPGILGTRSIKWNFTKFLVDRSGQVVARYAPTTKPQDLEKPLRKVLGLENRPAPEIQP